MRRNAYYGNIELVFFSVPPKPEDCERHVVSHSTDIMSIKCDWRSGARCGGMEMGTEGLVVTRDYEAMVRVLRAPRQKGRFGRVEFEESDTTNVKGRNVPVLVCDLK